MYPPPLNISETPKSPPVTSANPKSPIDISDSLKSPPKKNSPLVAYSSSSPFPSPKDGDQPLPPPKIPISAPPTSDAAKILLDAFGSYATGTGHRVELLEEQATRQMETPKRMDALIHATDELFTILKDTAEELSITNPALVTCLDLIYLDTSDISERVSRNNVAVTTAISALSTSHSALKESVDSLNQESTKQASEINFLAKGEGYFVLSSSSTDAGLDVEDRALMFLEAYDRATKQGRT